MREPPCLGVLKIAGAPLKVKIFFSTDVLLMVCKMTAQNTRTPQKKRERPSLPGARENYEKLPQNPQPNQTA